MVTTQCLFRVTLVVFINVVYVGAHPNVRNTEVSQELTSLPTAPSSVTGWVEVEEEQKPWRRGVSPPPFKSRRPPTAVIDAGCRKRVVCEAARTLTHMVPISNLWQKIVRGRPEPKNAYFAALSKGLLNKDCSELYPDCTDSHAGAVLPLVSEVVGPKGFLSSFLERLAMPSAPHVPRDSGTAGPSVFMDKIRNSKRRWKSHESWTSSEHFAHRHA